MSEARFILGIDLGGTHVKGLVVDEWGRVYAEDTRPTEDGAVGAWRDNVRRVVAGLQGRFPTIAVAGLCAPGLASRDEKMIMSMPGRLQGLEGLDWSNELRLPTVVLNDAHAALLGEVWGYIHSTDTRLVNVHVQRLRSKVEHDPEHPEIVMTVRGVGYKAGVMGGS